jgi:hypothetical protein
MQPLTRGLIAALVLIVLAAVFMLRLRTAMADYAVNDLAGERLVAGETLYQASDGHYMFKYFPSAALLYAPLSVLPLDVAKAVWFALTLAALAALFAVAARLVPAPRARWVLPLSGAILAKYLLHELVLGQINILVTLVVLTSLWQLSDPTAARAGMKAGALAGFAVALKPHAALFLLYLVLTRRWIGLMAALATIAAALSVPAVFYGVEGNLDVLRQWAATLSQSTPALLTNNDNVSVVALFTKWLGDAERALAPTAVVLGLLALVTLAVVWRGRGDARAHVLEGAFVLTLIPLVSPLGWDYTFLMALLAVALIVHHFAAFPKPARVLLAVNFATIAFALYDFMGRELYAAFMQWSVTTVNFVVVVLALAYLRHRRIA